MDWVMLAYRLPRVPSTPRIAVWRRLQRLGAAKLADGVVALPLDARTKEQLEWVAQEVADADGQASIWSARPSSPADERSLIDAINQSAAAEYRSLTERAISALDASPGVRLRRATAFRKEFLQIRSRDFFAVVERELARQAIDALALASEAAVDA